MIWENGLWRDETLQKYLAENRKGWKYEVIRIVANCPVFLHEHLSRLFKGAEKNQSKNSISQKELKAGLLDLIKQEELSHGNIRIQHDAETGQTIIGVIPHRYPTSENYSQGISTALLQMERLDPNIKTWNPIVRKSADILIQQAEVYEAILVNKQGFLTEGSRSNLFGIQNGKLITPPLKQVLPGITRQTIIGLSESNNIPFEEKLIHKNDIFHFDGFFISGTSPGVLPISRIDQNTFDPKNKLIHRLSILYLKAVEQNINQNC